MRTTHLSTIITYFTQRGVLDVWSWLQYLTLFHLLKIIFFKWANPGLFFIYFRSFQTIQYNFYNKSKKCSFSIQRWDSNPWPFKHESSPITTRPGLPPLLKMLLLTWWINPKKTMRDMLKMYQSVRSGFHLLNVLCLSLCAFIRTIGTVSGIRNRGSWCGKSDKNPSPVTKLN